MRVEPKKPNKKRLTIVAVVLLLVVSVGFAYYLYTTKPSDIQEMKDTTSNSNQQEEQTDINTDSTSEESQTTEEPTKVEGKTPTQYEGEDFNNEPDTDNERFRIPEGE